MATVDEVAISIPRTLPSTLTLVYGSMQEITEGIQKRCKSPQLMGAVALYIGLFGGIAHSECHAYECLTLL